MILVDILIPAVNRTYDFELDEERTTGEVVEKAAHLTACAEGMKECAADNMFLYAFQRERLLDKALSLKEQGIQSGETLILF